jgi:hypothetical protein
MPTQAKIGLEWTAATCPSRFDDAPLIRAKARVSGT